MPDTLAIIGGTGLTHLAEMKILQTHDLPTPFGMPSSAILEGTVYGERLLFLPRHGHPHSIPPHLVNYRANLWALQKLSATDVLAVNAVGGISKNMKPGTLVLPQQLIDYTHGRESTVFDGEYAPVSHIDFTHPYSDELRDMLQKAAQQAGEHLLNGGVYGVTQGPRLETAAEIFRMEHDGCDIVGMTGMPEASLARELKLRYASLALIVNHAAGKSTQQITMKEMDANLVTCMNKLHRIIEPLVRLYYRH